MSKLRYLSSTNQVGVDVVGSLFSTSDYTIFKKMKGNRKVVKNISLKEEIKEMGQLSPIVVNSKFEVLDGQHRLDILKELRVPVLFVVNNSVSPRAVISMNTAQRNWKYEDYLEFFISQGHSSYIRFGQIYSQYKNYISLPVLIDLASHTMPKEVFKDGELVIKDEVRMLSVLSFLKEFSIEVGYKSMTQALQIALIRFAKIDYVNRDRLIQKFKQLGMIHEKHLFVNREKAFETLIVNVYNHRLTEKSSEYIFYSYNNKKNIVIENRPK